MLVLPDLGRKQAGTKGVWKPKAWREAQHPGGYCAGEVTGLVTVPQQLLQLTSLLV